MPNTFLKMPDNKDISMKGKKTSKKNDEIEELKIFIKKKKNQNVALKKIIAKLNTDEYLTTNK